MDWIDFGSEKNSNLDNVSIKTQKMAGKWKSTYEHFILKLNCSVTEELWLVQWIENGVSPKL